MGADSHDQLRHKRVIKAARALSKQGRFRFTLRNFYYKLIRVGEWPAPREDPVAALARFKESLQEYEQRHGPVPGRIRHVDRLPEVDVTGLPPDVADYTTRRVLVCDRQETFLLFALNGFYRKIEIGLLVWPEYPQLVWQRIRRHMADGATMTFYLLHDCNRKGYHMRREMAAVLGEFGDRCHIFDLGLRFRQCCNLGITIHNDPTLASHDDVEALALGASGEQQEARLLLRSGSFAHLEELPPLRMMRWTYRRIAKRVEDLGYG